MQQCSLLSPLLKVQSNTGLALAMQRCNHTMVFMQRVCTKQLLRHALLRLDCSVVSGIAGAHVFMPPPPAPWPACELVVHWYEWVVWREGTSGPLAVYKQLHQPPINYVLLNLSGLVEGGVS